MSLEGKTLIYSAAPAVSALRSRCGSRRRGQRRDCGKTAEPNRACGTIHSARARSSRPAAPACRCRPTFVTRRRCWRRCGWRRALRRNRRLVNNASAIGLTATDSTPDEAIRPDARREPARHYLCTQACCRTWRVRRSRGATRSVDAVAPLTLKHSGSGRMLLFDRQSTAMSLCVLGTPRSCGRTGSA